MGLSKELIKADFNRAAANYEQYADLQKKVAEKLTKFGWVLFNPKGIILDLGSGTGFNKRILKPANIIQIDISENMCRKSAHLAPTLNTDMEQLPIRDNSVDGIISSLSLQWATDTKKVFDEIFRVLKPGCPFILSTFGIHTLQELKSVFRTMDPYTHINLFLDPEELAEKAKDAGLTNIEIKSELHMREYQDVMQLMKIMKKIGASNKQTGRKKSLSTRGYFNNIDRIYRKNFGHGGSIPATWEVLYMKGVKP